MRTDSDQRNMVSAAFEDSKIIRVYSPGSVHTPVTSNHTILRLNGPDNNLSSFCPDAVILAETVPIHPY